MYRMDGSNIGGRDITVSSLCSLCSYVGSDFSMTTKFATGFDMHLTYTNRDTLLHAGCSVQRSKEDP